MSADGDQTGMPTDGTPAQMPLPDDDGHHPFPIVAVGASAGGLEAFQKLLENLPANPGMAFILVQHLDPHRESRLRDVFSKSTEMPVLEAAHDMPVERDHVYIIPPNRNLAIAHGRLQVTPRNESHRPHLAIDHVFRSLAAEQKARAIGVLLSGTGSDGTQGLAEIKAVGGITFAQDEKSAVHSGMPLSAIDSGNVDFVLPPQDIAKRLLEIARQPYFDRAAAVQAQAEPPDAEAHYRKVLARVRAVTGVDFSSYRDTTIKRRIMRRMALHSQKSLRAYSERLETDEAEVRALYEDLLIKVTSFFRDSQVFEALKRIVYPEITKNKPSMAPIRVWVPGCSTGQEAYSIAMTLLEFFDDRPVRPPIQIFATDLSDPAALEKARAGLYPASIEGEVTPERLRRFFVKEDSTYRINKSIRDLCVFARQNITVDPPFSHVDLISCRNVLIYLTPSLQHRVLPAFHYALNVPGFLVLGSAESVGDSSNLFEVVDRANKIYAKKLTATRPHLQFISEDLRRSGSPTGTHRPNVPSVNPTDFQREADRILLGRYSPAGVLVNENLDIIQFRGRTSRYLESPPGEPTTNLLKMSREGLFLELRNLCAEASREKKPVRRDKVRVRSNGNVYEISVDVLPVRPPGVNESCLLVLFHESQPPERTETDAADPFAAEPRLPVGKVDADAEAELAQLRKELIATKEYLQTMIEQQDAANEELRSANEEILSSNEELQSTNEELETAKEELQSTNEELTTVNEQLHFRNIELNQLTNDLTNLLTSTGIPVVMVGPDLRVRRFTAAARKSMNLLASDVGRPIGDLKPPVEVPDLEKMIGEVIDEVQVREREVRDRDGRWNLLRIHPYRTMDNKIDGAVLLLLDIDEVKRAQEALRESEAQLRLALEAGSAGTLQIDLKTGKMDWGDMANSIFGLSANSERNYETFMQLLHPEDRSKFESAVERAMAEHSKYTEEVRILQPGGETIWLLVKGQAFYGPMGEPLHVRGVCIDITERKRMSSELEQLVMQLKESDRRKDEFLATLAHELRNPLAPMANAVQILRNPNITPAQAQWCRDIIDRQLGQMARLLDDLLDVSRITRNALHFRAELVDLRTTLANAVEAIRPLIDSNRQKLNLDLPDKPVPVHGDAVRLTQIVSNLLNNSARYTEPGGAIDVSVDVENQTVTVLIRDTGIGIAPDLLPHIFDIFYQGSSPGSSPHAGLGLGLTLAKHLVELHKGTIEAKSGGEGRGSEFVVRLPVALETGNPSSDAHLQSSREDEPVKTMRILVVDDREPQARSLGMLLESIGHQVRIATNGQQALNVAREFMPEVALIDIGLPDLNGYEVARRLRQEPGLKNMLLIAQTGWGRDEDRKRAREAGFDHHLAKPLNHHELLRLIAHGRGE